MKKYLRIQFYLSVCNILNVINTWVAVRISLVQEYLISLKPPNLKILVVLLDTSRQIPE